jgi:hypothetical protein
MMKLSNAGQAVIEYLFVFALFSTIALGVATGIGGYSTSMFHGFAYQLTRDLTTGTCAPPGCWHFGYKNGNE